MTDLKQRMTRHAVARSQQRGITEEQMEFVMKYGSKCYVGDGCVSYSMNKKARLRAQRALNINEYRSFAAISIYVVVTDDGTIRTVAHVFRRAPRRS